MDHNFVSETQQLGCGIRATRLKISVPKFWRPGRDEEKAYRY